MNRIRKKPYTIYFGLLQFVNVAAAITISVFLVMFLIENGYSEVEVGMFMALMNFVGIFSQPLMGILADQIRSYKKVLSVAIVVGIIVQLLMSGAAANRTMMIFLIVAYSLSFRSCGALIDSWTIGAATKTKSVNYGVARAMGSIGSSVASVVVGRLVGVFGINSIFYIFAVFAACAVVTVFLIGDDSVEYKSKEKTAKVSIGELARNSRGYIYLEICLLIAFIAYWPTTATYYSVLLLEYGGTSDNIGIAQAIMSFSEVPILIISSKLINKFGDKKLILIGLFMLVLRIFIHIPATASPVMLTIAPIMQGFSYGILFPAALHFIGRIVPVSMRTTAITINAVILFNITGIIGNALSGFVIERFGLLSIYWIGTFIILTAAIILAVLFATLKDDEFISIRK